MRGDVDLLRLGGLLKAAESKERNLKRLVASAKTDARRDDIAKKIEKARSQFNDRF